MPGKDKKQDGSKSSLSAAAANRIDSKGKKKKKTPLVNQEKRKGRMKEYFKGVKVETKKVVWPTRKELVSYTVIVIFTCAFFALLIWGVDSAFLAALGKLLGIEYAG
ncbi:MAG: preprotein translocase subunit SecE [Clostridiales Family XIII bacterium]|jgi:preprotein translocase subunit SecE|nr:preprotein translocase subunit SecE [Clostridiales Family XIII bacterium]